MLSACGRVCLIPSLLSNHASKSEVMFFFLFFLWSKSLTRHIQLLRAGANSKKGDVLATEMRWKTTNMLSQTGTRGKSLVPNLPPPLTSASDLMAQSVFLFKISHQGTVNTSISQRAPGNTRARPGNAAASSETGSTLNAVYRLTNSVHYFKS